ncbi:MAG: Lrp/AsnC ligand binding domain-containing protein [Nitrososphaerales archaeon]
MPIAYVLINCDLGSEEAIIKEIQKIPEVKEVRGVYGVFDIFAKVESDDMAHLRDVITLKIRRMDRVRSTNTLMAIEEQGGK